MLTLLLLRLSVQTDRLANTPRYKTHHIKRRLGEGEKEQSSFLVHLLENNFELKHGEDREACKTRLIKRK